MLRAFLDQRLWTRVTRAIEAQPNVDTVIKGFALGLNDTRTFARGRRVLEQILPKIANTQPQERRWSRRRADTLCDWVVREVVPMVIDATRRDIGDEFRRLPPIVDDGAQAAAAALAEYHRRDIVDSDTGFLPISWAIDALKARATIGGDPERIGRLAAATAQYAVPYAWPGQMWHSSIVILKRLIAMSDYDYMNAIHG